MIQYWILTFNRPKSLERLVGHFNEQGIHPNIYSNAPTLQSYPGKHSRLVFNHVGNDSSSSWCARSWNSIYLKALEAPEYGDSIVCLQDDTDISPNFVKWIEDASTKYDFMFGPAGDQFHYITKSVVQKVGWWDERYNGCYCADADYLRRVMHHYDKPDRVSVEESHGWGFFYNSSGIAENVIPRNPYNVVDADYKNQHTHLDEIAKTDQKDKFTTNYVVEQARHNYETKWGVPLVDNRPCAAGGQEWPLTTEYDWYPWATKKYGVTRYG